MRADTQKRLDALERLIKGEVDSINSRAAINMVSAAMQPINSSATWREPRTLDTQINNLSGQTAKSLGERLEHEAAQIRDAMTGREALAEMLSEIALRLKNEFRVPGV